MAVRARTDSLTGGTSADTFIFESASAFANQDTVTDFSTVRSDKLDHHDILSSFDPVHDANVDFVHLTTSGANTIVSMGIDGAGTARAFANIPPLNGETSLDPTTLYNNGRLSPISSSPERRQAHPDVWVPAPERSNPGNFWRASAG